RGPPSRPSFPTRRSSDLVRTRNDRGMKIADLMRREVISVPPDATLKRVAALLVEHRISGLPVVLPDGQVVGVISEADILLEEQRSEEHTSELQSRSDLVC